jgi:phytoene dehydrogenase-like protein
MQRETNADVAIIGADLAGLVAAAILTKHGRRVVLLEHADTIGGRSGAVQTPEGYWIDFGHRDAHGVGDCQFPWHHGAEAARLADVTIASHPITRVLRVHRLPDGPMLDGGNWSAGGFLASAREFFECPADGLDELRSVLERLAGAKPDEVDAALPVQLGTWVETNVRHPGVRRALLLMAAVIFHPRPAEASVGRLMLFFQNPKGLPHIADDHEVGGMQGLMEPWARAVRERGGEIMLGWKPVEIIVDAGRVRGAVAVDRSNLVHEVHAPVVISTYPVWENLTSSTRGAFPPHSSPRRTLRYRADLIGWRRTASLPTVRAAEARRSPGVESLSPRRQANALCGRLSHPVADQPPRRAAGQASALVGHGALLRRRHDFRTAVDGGARAPRYGDCVPAPLLRRL